MDAKAFLASQGRELPLKPITIRLCDPHNPARIAEAKAVLRLVPARVRFLCDEEAAKVAAQFPNATANRLAEEQAFHLIAQAVRQDGAPAAVFFESVADAKAMLVDSEAARVLDEYRAYVAESFPTALTPQQAAKIAEDAKVF